MGSSLALSIIVSFLLVVVAGNTNAQTSIPIEARGLVSGEVELSWSAEPGIWQLESSLALGASARWTIVSETPSQMGDRLIVHMAASSATRFFRLRVAAPLRPARIVETSPSPGETGVSVGRETILRLDLPLTASTLLLRNSLFAEAAGRRLLTQAELSKDRRTLTLFYLEPIPGSTRVRVTVQGDDLTDIGGRALDADGDGLPGGGRVIEFSTSGTEPVSNTAVIGRVFASEVTKGTGSGTNSVHLPLSGVTITVDGAEETLRTTTDNNGNFRLEPAPSGRFFVHVDGRTAVGSQWPNGAYYPAVGKAWEAEPGRDDNLAGGNGEIYLPLIAPGTLQPVSSIAETRITFPPTVLSNNPALAGVELIVPANALVDDQGNRGGRVGIAPVPADRLPEPLPPGLELPLVFTIQTDGPLNFDEPAPIRLPNLPDPITGERLPAGAKSALWSFNHDTGRWEVQGPMTVTSDGLYVVSDPGIGIRQPGWHGTRPASPPKPAPMPKKEEEPDCDCDNLFLMTAIENLLYAIADGMNVIAGSDNYAGDHVRQFMDGNGEPLIDGPGSPRSEDLHDSKAYADELTNVHLDLQSRIRNALRNDPNASVLGDFEHETTGLSFYGESGLPGGELQLGYTFGEVSRGDVDVNLSAVSFERVEGGYRYLANLEFTVHERYEFNSNDRKEKESISFPALAKCLQDCGYATPFDSSVTTLDTIEGFIPSPSLASEEDAGNARRTKSIQLQAAPDPRTFARELPVRVTTAFSNSGLRLVIQPDGSHVYGSANELAPQRCFYAIEDEATGVIIRRGITGDQGYAFEDAVVGANGRFRFHLLSATTLEVATATVMSASPGFFFDLPPFILGPGPTNDMDGDDLSDFAERIVGTSPTLADTDQDGVRDGAEVRQGRDPSNQRPAQAGILATVRTDPRVATEVAIADGMVLASVTPDSLLVFNAFAGLAPTLVADLDLTQTPRGIAAEGRWGAAALGNSGVAIVDLNQLMLRVIPIFEATAVTVGGSLISAGTADGRVALIEAETGILLDELSLPQRDEIVSLLVVGDFLYVLQPQLGSQQVLHAIDVQNEIMSVAGSLSLPDSFSPPQRRYFLSAGDDFLLLSHASGFNVLSLTNAAAPTRIRNEDLRQFGFKQIVPNGSGLGVAAADPFSTGDGAHDLQLYQLGDLTQPAVYLTDIVTPGFAGSLRIANGLAYVADGSSGVHVVNYLETDVAGRPPTVVLRTSLDPFNPAIVEGERVRLQARVTDDVQVARVEFWRDGSVITTDVSYPFETRFTAPTRASAPSGFRVRARAIDTGGNAAWSDEIQVRIDAAPAGLVPRYVSPEAGSTRARVRSVAVGFSTPLDPASFTEDTLRVFGGGPDGTLGTADDIRVPGGELVYREIIGRLLLVLPDELAPGRYRAELMASLRSAAGVPLTAPRAWEFTTSDGSPPAVLATLPPEGGLLASDVVTVVMDQALDPTSISPESVTFTAAGEDGRLDTADDIELAARLRPGGAASELTYEFPAGIQNGLYRGTIHAGLRDLSGLVFATERRWQFRVQDSIPPALEATAPAQGAFVRGDFMEVRGSFDERMDGAVFMTNNVSLMGRGQDRVPGTADDVSVEVTAVRLEPDGRSFVIAWAEPLAPDIYHVVFSPAPKDLRGNPAQVNWSFNVIVETTFMGRVVNEVGESLDRAEVRIGGFDASATTDSAGVFRFENLELPPGVTFAVRAERNQNGQQFLGVTRGVVANHQGLTDVGTIITTVRCEPRFTAGLFLQHGVEEPVNALTVFDDGTGPTVYAALDSSGGRIARVMRWRNGDWETVGAPFGGGLFVARLQSLAVFNDGSGPALYAGGWFESVGDVPATNVARWNGVQWAPVGAGLIQGLNRIPEVRAFAVYDDGRGSALYAGGAFTRSGTNALAGIARWNGQSWTDVGGGIRGEAFSSTRITSMSVYNDGAGPALFVGGTFVEVGGVPAANLARWNGSAWSSVGGGVTNAGSGTLVSVDALQTFNDGAGLSLFVGGTFDHAGSLVASNVARWNGQTWTALGSGVTSSPFGNAPGVRAFAVFGGELVAAGTFDGAGGEVPALGIARWNGTRWSLLGAESSFGVGLGGSGLALAEFGGELFVGGRFTGVTTTSGVVPANHVTRWSLVNGWLPAGTGLDGQVRALATTASPTNATVLVAGDFRYADSHEANGVALWRNGRFERLGEGLIVNTFGTPFHGEGHAIIEFDDGRGPAIFVGGRFDFAGGTAATNIARWTGSAWEPVGGGLVDSFGQGRVEALATWYTGTQTILVAGGRIERSGEVLTAGVAGWNGTSWGALGTGLRGDVYALTQLDTDEGPRLLAGGQFNGTAGSTGFFANVAAWDGSNWLPLGAGTSASSLNGAVRTLLAAQESGRFVLYAGGSFDRTSDGTPLGSGIARWDGNRWTGVGGGLGQGAEILTLAQFDDDSGPAIYAGGRIFRSTPDLILNIARWDGFGWTGLGSGVAGQRVMTLTVQNDVSAPALLMGGFFEGVGQGTNGLVSVNMARWYRPPTPCPP